MLKVKNIQGRRSRCSAAAQTHEATLVFQAQRFGLMGKKLWSETKIKRRTHVVSLFLLVLLEAEGKTHISL